MKIAALVPSLNPDAHFAGVIEDLIAAGFGRIYVVNDGSRPDCLARFDEAAKRPECVVLHHERNMGKGRALKTAFARYIADDEGLAGMVTLDGDGQHAAADVVRVANALEENPNALVLGARDFSQMNVPAKSKLGNKLTRFVFRAACGIPITDTQTGLRGIPNGFLRALTDVDGERYEYETNMLMETKPRRVPVIEIPISTIYIDNNSASHFRPFQDSLRIYARILKYAASSVLGFCVDYALFNLLYYLPLALLPEGARVLLATAGARVCSALCNFFTNKRLVFKSSAGTGGALARYALLCAVQMACSFGGVYLFSSASPVPAWLAKIIVDTALFFASYFVQRGWVFRAGKRP